MMQPPTMSTAITEGVRVIVTSRYVPEPSDPRARRYVFAYTVRISNESSSTVQVKTATG